MRRASQVDVQVAYLKFHLGEWVSMHRLSEVADGSVYTSRGLRRLRATGLPIENDKNGNWMMANKPINLPVNTDKRKVTSKLRWQVLVRDKHRCQGCHKGVEDFTADGEPIRLEVDHIVPWSKGGKTELSNLQTLCHVCNHGKKDLVLE